MAHHTYPPGTPTGVVPTAYVVPETDWAHILAALYKSINGDEGGTWAPSGFITVGGSGFSLTGTGHQVAAAARVTVQSTGEIRVANGGLIKLDGTNGDIDLKVTSNVALIDVGNGAAIRILAGGSLDVLGTIAVSSAGPGTVTWADNTTAAFNDGSELIFYDGSLATFNSGSELVVESGGNITLNGVMTVPGQIIISGTGDISVASGGLILGVSGATLTWQGTVNLSTLNLVGASTWPTLNSSRTWSRHSLQIYTATFSDGQDFGSAGEPLDSWVETGDVANTPRLRTNPAAASGRYTIVVFHNLPQGGIITTATIRSKGVNNTVTGMPLYEIVRWQGGEANFEAIGSQLDSHSPSAFADSIATTTITASANQTVDNAYQYGVKIYHPYNSDPTTAVSIYDIKINGTIAVIQSN